MVSPNPPRPGWWLALLAALVLLADQASKHAVEKLTAAGSSRVLIPGLLNGHETIARRADYWFNRMAAPTVAMDAHAGDRRLGVRGRE